MVFRESVEDMIKVAKVILKRVKAREKIWMDQANQKQERGNLHVDRVLEHFLSSS